MRVMSFSKYYGSVKQSDLLNQVDSAKGRLKDRNNGDVFTMSREEMDILLYLDLKLEF